MSQFLWNHSKDRPEGTSAGASMFKPDFRFQGKELQVHEDAAERLGGRRLGEEKGVFNIKSQGKVLPWVTKPF